MSTVNEGFAMQDIVLSIQYYSSRLEIMKYSFNRARVKREK